MFLINFDVGENEIAYDVMSNRAVAYYNGVRTFIEKISGTSTSIQPFRRASMAENAFYSFSSYDEALDTFLNKPETLIKYVQSELDLMHKEEIGIDHWYDITGDFLDIGLLLDGEPEHFGNMYMGNPKRTFVTILLKLDVSWSTTADYLQYYAARVLRLVEWLERKEVRTRIIAFSSTEIEHLEIILKQYHDPLTLASIAIVANPDFYRRCVFRLRELSRFWNATYGSTEEADKRFSKLLPDLTKEKDSVIIYLDRSIYENNREITNQAFDSAEEYLQKILLDEERFGALIV